MKKIGLLVLLLVVLVACEPKKEVNEASGYAKKVASYVHSVKSFSKNVTKIYKSNKSDGVKVKEIKTQAEMMKKRINAFNALTPPDSMKLVHRKIEMQNYVFYDSLSVYIGSVKAGHTGKQAMKEFNSKVRTNETVNVIKDILKKKEK